MIQRARSTDTPHLVSEAAGLALWRVSRDPTGTAFSTSATRRRRFSPMYAPDGSVVPAWYGTTTNRGAIFESVFPDSRPSHAVPRVMPNQYVDRVLAPVVTTRDLSLVDLTTDGLQAIGIRRTALIESTSQRYAWTNEIARHLRVAEPTVDGFIWISRARDTARSVVLYADAGRAPMIGPAAGTPLLLASGPGLLLLREVATPAGITVVVPSDAA